MKVDTYPVYNGNNKQKKSTWVTVAILIGIVIVILSSCCAAKKTETIQDRITLLGSSPYLTDSIMKEFSKSGSPLKSAFIRNDTLFINQ